MLSERFGILKLQQLLLSREDWNPFPKWQDRVGWGAVPQSLQDLLLQAGQERIGFEYPALPATLFLDYMRTGRRTPFQEVNYARRYALVDLVLAECVEGAGRFLDDIVNGIWAICEETFWGLPAHILVQKAGNTLPDKYEPTVDLFAAETGAMLAWTDYLLGEELDAVSPVVRPRMAREITERILDVNRHRIDLPWQGNLGGRRVNNWNPWICSNWLTCLLAIEEDPRRRAEDVHFLMQTLDRFIDPYPRDGGCDEGPNYWGRAGLSLYDNLELLYRATCGQVDLFGDDLVREIGRFIYRAHIHDDYYLNFADASALVVPEAALVFNYGIRIADPAMVDFGSWLVERQNFLQMGFEDGTGVKKPSSLGRALASLFPLKDLEEAKGTPPLSRDVWLPDTEVMCARDEAGSAKGFYVALKGGHNEESHNHNDIGAFVIYADGKPLLVDIGVEEYTAKTFGPDRYDIWTMQSAFHNLLPTVNGAQQQPGEQYKARDMQWQSNDGRAQATLDIAPAYGPEAGIVKWERKFVLTRGEEVRIEDTYKLDPAPQSLILSVVTPCKVSWEPGDRKIQLGEREIVKGRNSGTAQLLYDPDRFDPSVESLPITDGNMGPVWGTELYRITFTCKRLEAEATCSFAVRI